MLEALAAARKVREIAAVEGRLHLCHSWAVEDLHQRLPFEVAEDLFAVSVVAAVRHAAIGENHHPREKRSLHASIKFSMQVGFLVDVERLARLLDHACVAELMEMEQPTEIFDRLIECQARAHLLNLDSKRMSFRLPEKIAGELDELVEIAARAKLRIDARIHRIEADAKPLQRRREQFRANFFRQQKTIGAHAGLWK